jgi:flotillin
MPMVAMAVGAVVLVLVLAVAWKAFRQVAAPDEALIISGLGAKAHDQGTGEAVGFKIVTGKGTMVLPGFQTCRRLSLRARTVDLDVACATSDGVDVRVRGAVTYRVGDDLSSIADAARRFLDQQELMDEKAQEIFAGRLRSAADDLVVWNADRGGLADQVRVSAARKMGRLGLVADSLRIQDVEAKNPRSGQP